MSSIAKLTVHKSITEKRERKLTEVNFTEGSASDLAAKLILAADNSFHEE